MRGVGRGAFRQLPVQLAGDLRDAADAEVVGEAGGEAVHQGRSAARGGEAKVRPQRYAPIHDSVLAEVSPLPPPRPHCNTRKNRRPRPETRTR